MTSHLTYNAATIARKFPVATTLSLDDSWIFQVHPRENTEGNQHPNFEVHDYEFIEVEQNQTEQVRFKFVDLSLAEILSNLHRMWWRKR